MQKIVKTTAHANPSGSEETKMELQTIKLPKPKGHIVIAGGLVISISRMPNKFQQYMMRWLLGWRFEQ